VFDIYDKEISNLKRCLENTIQVGKVSEVSHELGRVKVKFFEAETDFIPVLTSFANDDEISQSLPSLGSQVLVLTALGDFTNSYVLGVIATHKQSSRKNTDYKKYSDGTVIEYDSEKKLFNIEASGNIKIKCKKAEIESSEGVSIKGDLEVSKNIKAGSDVKIGPLSLKNHTHIYIDSVGNPPLLKPKTTQTPK